MAVPMAMTHQMTLHSKSHLMTILHQYNNSENLPKRHSSPYRPSFHSLQVPMLYADSLTRRIRTPLPLL